MHTNPFKVWKIASSQGIVLGRCLDVFQVPGENLGICANAVPLVFLETLTILAVKTVRSLFTAVPSIELAAIVVILIVTVPVV